MIFHCQSRAVFVSAYMVHNADVKQFTLLLKSFEYKWLFIIFSSGITFSLGKIWFCCPFLTDCFCSIVTFFRLLPFYRCILMPSINIGFPNLMQRSTHWWTSYKKKKKSSFYYQALSLNLFFSNNPNKGFLLKFPFFPLPLFSKCSFPPVFDICATQRNTFAFKNKIYLWNRNESIVWLENLYKIYPVNVDCRGVLVMTFKSPRYLHRKISCEKFF